MAIRLHLAFTLGLWTLAGGVGSATDQWNQFLGPQGRPVSDAKTVPVEFTLADEDLIQITSVPGKGHSSPVIWGNKLVLTTVVDETHRQVLCYDTADISKPLWVWSQEFQQHKKHRDNEFASSTPCMDEDRIYISWTSGAAAQALALDHSGNLLWEKTLGSFEGDHGSASSPVLAGNGIFVFWDDLAGRKTAFALLNPEDGADLWRVTSDWPGESGELKTTYSTPLVYKNKHDVTEIITTSMIFGVLSLDATTGEKLWQFADDFSQRTVGSPVIEKGILFATWGSGNGAKDHVALRPGSESKSGKPEVVWRKTTSKGMPYVPTVLPHDGRLYMLGDSGTMLCVDVESGEPVFGPEDIGGKFYSNPILIDGKIYCASRGINRDGTGELIVLEAGMELKELGRSKLDSGVAATPAVGNGKLFIRTYDHLIAVGKP